MRIFLRMAMLALVAALAGCADPRFQSPDFKMRYATAEERRETLAHLRVAWFARPMEISVKQNGYERRLIARAAVFGRRIKNTETYRAACAFWVSCQREHIERYDDGTYEPD